MERAAAIKRVLWVVLGLNLAVAVGKLVVGVLAGSLAMVADGFHSLLDGSSNLIGLVGIQLAARPPDLDHHYGHQKYEAFAALGIALLLGITAVGVVRAGIERLLDGARPEPTVAGVGVMLATMIVNAAVTRYEARAGRRLRSQVLLADAAHTRSDLLVSLSVLAGLGAVWLGWYWVDAAVAFVIAALILWISYGILKRVSGELTDTAQLSPEEIAAEVLAVPGVRSSSNIRSRGTPPYLFIDLEIQLPPELSLHAAHEVAHRVRDRLMGVYEAADVVVHVEPDTPGRAAAGPGAAAAAGTGRP